MDCLGKLFSFTYLDDFVEAPIASASATAPSPSENSMIDSAISTVCGCFTGENTSHKVELQIVKALMAAILNDELVAHGATLLKAIRQTYTIFVVSSSPANQTIAQATLSQMINVVFERVKTVFKRTIATPLTPSTPSLDSGTFSSTYPPTRTDSKEDQASSSVSLSRPPNTKLTLRQMESLNSSDDIIGDDIAPNGESESDMFAKDAFLVFRTLCKLSEKPLESEKLDLKSQPLRSKLLSLHLIHTILKSHMTVFLSNDILIKSNLKGDETFLVSVKDYICSTLARNAASIAPPIFEISAEIFWLIISNLRSQFKKEIEVFFAEIYFPITEMKTSTPHQKQYFLSIIQKLSNDPRALVEIYLNYDCDSSSSINIYEAIIDFLVRLAVSPIHLTPLQQQHYMEQRHRSIATYNLSLPPVSSIANISTQPQNEPQFPIEHALKMTALSSLTAALRSLLSWSQRRIAAAVSSLSRQQKPNSVFESTQDASVASISGPSLTDDPTEFASLKIKKTALLEAIRQFNIKPKKGIAAFISSGIIENRNPTTIANVLLNTEGLDKALLGEYLGEGDPENIAIMHAFVDLMDFTNLSFVNALRVFLQSFRLPGEAQKIDRFMLKFAERYILGNPAIFANADTAYVLAYSVILLNTDQHSSQIKVRMTVDDFIKNNRGINDNADLPEQFLVEIYNTIQSDEIKLMSEQHAALIASSGQQTQSGFAGIGQVLATVGGRDLQREAYMQASREMSNKTEQMFKELMSKSDGRRRSEQSNFYIASHVEHVKPMFEVAWMSFLAGLSGPFQQSDDAETIKLCLEGFKYSIRIACLFGNDLARISFVSALAQFTNLQNLGEMTPKNVEAIKKLLDTALTEGNFLKSSWKDVLTCISQLERFQLISSGIAAGVIPDVTNARLANRSSIEIRTANISGKTYSSGTARSSYQQNSGSTTSLAIGPQANTMRHPVYSPQLGEMLQAREVVIMMDKIFTKSESLSGDAIVDFVKALTEVSWEEIQSSGLSEHPRTFSLQKMVDVSYYNMERIRFEWSQLWIIMRKSFNQVGCHENTSVVFFALDSLRQLSMRFFDLDELSHFKFQKDFLEPFEYIIANNHNPQVQDMVLQCLRQMILSKPLKIKSGWRTMFSVLSQAAKLSSVSIVNDTFDLVKMIHKENFFMVLAQESYGDMIACLSEIGKNQRFQKPSLHSIELLKETIKQNVIPLTENAALREHVSPETAAVADEELYMKLWLPLLLAFHDVIMNGEDLEVRSRALNYLFDILVEQGSKFSSTFWNAVCRQILFPTFVVLKSRSEMARFNTQDNMSVWLSTTMIQALRNMISLLTHYFHILSRMLDGFLDLLVDCILQENETVSRIGSSCFLQLVEKNVNKLDTSHWAKLVDRLVYLFEVTTPAELLSGCFEDKGEAPLEKDLGFVSASHNRSESNSHSYNTPPHTTPSSSTSLAMDEEENKDTTTVTEVSTAPRRHARKSSWVGQNHQKQKLFRETIVKCILQLLMIDTVQEMLEKPKAIPIESTNGGSHHKNGEEEHVIPPVTKLRTVGSNVYDKVPGKELLRIMHLLRKSYVFARDFNAERELRTNLWRQGFMKQLPNLLKQESFSAHIYISVMMRFYNDYAKQYDNGETLESLLEVDPQFVTEAYKLVSHKTEGSQIVLAKAEDLKLYIESLLIPLCLEILNRFSELDMGDTRNVNTWTPVVVGTLEGISYLSSQDFVRLVPTLYPVLLSVLDQELTPELRASLKSALLRVSDYLSNDS